MPIGLHVQLAAKCNERSTMLRRAKWQLVSHIFIICGAFLLWSVVGWSAVVLLFIKCHQRTIGFYLQAGDILGMWHSESKHWQTGQTQWIYFPLPSRIMGWRLRISRRFLISLTHLPRTCRISSQAGGAVAIMTAEPPASCPTTF